MKPASITETELHAYVDGALPAARQLQVEAWLQTAPEDAERVRIYREQNASLRALFNPVLDETVPPALLASASAPPPPADQHASQPSWSRWSLQRIAAGVVLALASGAAGWSLHGWQSAAQYAQSTQDGETLLSRQIATLPQQAAIAHVVFSPEVKHPVEVGADQEAHLVAWLSKRLGTSLRPPKLAPLGYDLVGGRLLPGSSGPVAQFMYTDSGGQRLTLYVAAENSDNRDTGFRFAQEGQVNVFYWIDGKFGYALSGGISKNDLSRIASSVYDQLQTK